MSIPRMPKSELATAHLLITKKQHKRMHSLSKKRNLRIPEIFETMLFAEESFENGACNKCGAKATKTLTNFSCDNHFKL